MLCETHAGVCALQASKWVAAEAIEKLRSDVEWRAQAFPIAPAILQVTPTPHTDSPWPLTAWLAGGEGEACAVSSLCERGTETA